MAYTDEQVAELRANRQTITSDLGQLMFNTVVAGQNYEHVSVRKHLLHGVARRVDVMKRTINNIFDRFPPDTTRPLSKDALSDVQINLHAFVTNLDGVFDNWAWAFVYRHGLENDIPRREVGLFRDRTTQHLSAVLRDYVTSEHITRWHAEYLKSFRDALAHRIPLYVPPSEVTPAEGERYNELEKEKVQLIQEMKWERLNEVEQEQAEIGRPCFEFLHSYSEGGQPQAMLIHPQVLCDAGAVVEFGNMYLEHWHEKA